MAETMADGLILVDVGNTETHVGLWYGGELGGVRAVATRATLTADEAEMLLLSLLRLFDWKGTSERDEAGDARSTTFCGAILSCVVPSLTDAWRKALASFSATRPMVVGPGLKTGVRMRYHDPSEIGPDRIADVVAARETYGTPVVVVDLGTTTNIEVVDAEGAFLGGIIAPGLRLGARALSEAAARLPMIELRAPRAVVGRTTREAMQSGVVLGEVARIDGLLDAVARELGYGGKIVISGEDARTIAALLVHDVTVDETLTLRGLALLWKRNQR